MPHLLTIDRPPYPRERQARAVSSLARSIGTSVCHSGHPCVPHKDLFISALIILPSSGRLLRKLQGP
ncbi:hypothetical protein AAFF_G00311650 [Aldrovandia affinis]|uniref:Uncharacterized protein n=1 Tax=Aldrovandia affinis TaxID=143900 RepID=A0AAD7SNK9_9TELE|nr:hypothetical protein AAFF_G00311650 [Aldrovandia affinis]